RWARVRGDPTEIGRRRTRSAPPARAPRGAVPGADRRPAGASRGRARRRGSSSAPTRRCGPACARGRPPAETRAGARAHPGEPGSPAARGVGRRCEASEAELLAQVGADGEHHVVEPGSPSAAAVLLTTTVVMTHFTAA